MNHCGAGCALGFQLFACTPFSYLIFHSLLRRHCDLEIVDVVPKITNRERRVNIQLNHTMDACSGLVGCVG